MATHKIILTKKNYTISEVDRILSNFCCALMRKRTRKIEIQTKDGGLILMDKCFIDYFTKMN